MTRSPQREGKESDAWRELTLVATLVAAALRTNRIGGSPPPPGLRWEGLIAQSSGTLTTPALAWAMQGADLDEEVRAYFSAILQLNRELNRRLLNKLGIDDPRLIQLAQLMSRPTAPPSNDDEGEMIEMVRAERVEELQDEIERLKGVNRILFEQCEFMAAAVGACPQCWGEDADCRDE